MLSGERYYTHESQTEDLYKPGLIFELWRGICYFWDKTKYRNHVPTKYVEIYLLAQRLVR